MPAKRASVQDHKMISDIARMSKYTTGFTNILYSGPENYAKGWIGKYEVVRGTISGFICLRHAVRKQVTVVYDVGVHPSSKNKGVGRKLIEWAMEESPYKIVQLNVDDRNKDALKFYRKLGFRKIAVGKWKSGHTYTTFSITKDKLHVCKR